MVASRMETFIHTPKEQLPNKRVCVKTGRFVSNNLLLIHSVPPFCLGGEVTIFVLRVLGKQHFGESICLEESNFSSTFLFL